MARSNKPPKTSLQKAKNSCVSAGVLAYISAAVTLLFILLEMSGVVDDLGIDVDVFTLIDVGLLVVLGTLVLALRSRVSAIVLLLYFLLSKVLQFIDDPQTLLARNAMWFSVVFLAAYINGVIGAFTYQKLKRQAKDGASNPYDQYQGPFPDPDSSSKDDGAY